MGFQDLHRQPLGHLPDHSFGIQTGLEQFRHIGQGQDVVFQGLDGLFRSIRSSWTKYPPETATEPSFSMSTPRATLEGVCSDTARYRVRSAAISPLSGGDPGEGSP